MGAESAWRALLLGTVGHPPTAGWAFPRAGEAGDAVRFSSYTQLLEIGTKTPCRRWVLGPWEQPLCREVRPGGSESRGLGNPFLPLDETLGSHLSSSTGPTWVPAAPGPLRHWGCGDCCWVSEDTVSRLVSSECCSRGGVGTHRSP